MTFKGSAVCGLAIALGFAAAAPIVRSQSTFPSSMITIVVPFPAGGTADLLPRLVAEQMRPDLGQPVVILNRPGASGNIGMESVFRAGGDGYTLVNAPQLSFSVNHLLNPNLRFDPTAMTPISVIATYPTVLFVRASLPVGTLSELISHARANPGKLNYASQGLGQIGHLTIEALKIRAGLEMTHVPYRGSAPAINDLLAGHVDLLADNLLAGMEHVESGRLKLIAVGGKARIKSFPSVPTLAEVLPGFYSDTWMAIAAPPNTPKEIADRLSRSVAKAVRQPAVRSRIEGLQADVFGSSPDQMSKLIAESRERWAPIIAKAKITAAE